MEKLSNFVGYAAAFVFAVLTLDVLLGVFSRYIVGHQVNWTEEMATFLLVWLTFLGASVAYFERAHLGIDLLVRKFDPDVRILATRCVQALVLIFILAVLVFGGILLFKDRWQAGQLMPTLGIRKAWLYMAVPVNGVIMALFCFGQILVPGGDNPVEKEAIE